jgi:hypothetical protein
VIRQPAALAVQLPGDIFSLISLFFIIFMSGWQCSLSDLVEIDLDAIAEIPIPSYPSARCFDGVVKAMPMDWCGE